VERGLRYFQLVVLPQPLEPPTKVAKALTAVNTVAEVVVATLVAVVALAKSMAPIKTVVAVVAQAT
jgi:hypothetical protein